MNPIKIKYPREVTTEYDTKDIFPGKYYYWEDGTSYDGCYVENNYYMYITENGLCISINVNRPCYGNPEFEITSGDPSHYSWILMKAWEADSHLYDEVVKEITELLP